MIQTRDCEKPSEHDCGDSGETAGGGAGFKKHLGSRMVGIQTWVRSLGWEDPLEKGKSTHSSILAWRIPWT